MPAADGSTAVPKAGKNNTSFANQIKSNQIKFS